MKSFCSFSSEKRIFSDEAPRPARHPGRRRRPAALLAPWLGLPDPVRQDVAQRLALPGPGSLLGRDEFGRDVLARLVGAVGTSLTVAFASALIACVCGTLLGLMAAWFRGLGGMLALGSTDIILALCLSSWRSSS